MKPLKIIYKEVIKTSILRIVVLLIFIGLNLTGLLAVGQTFAYFSNTKVFIDNTFQTAVLDITVRSPQPNFSPSDKASNLKKNQRVNRDIYVGKTALSLPLKHRVSFDFINGNLEVCNQLDLELWYDHYHGPFSGGYDNRDMRLTYIGKLSALDKYTNIDFIIPHPDDQFDTNPSDGTEQWFYYSLSLPDNAPDNLQGEICQFKFIFDGWQKNIDTYENSGFSNQDEIESTIKVGYWDTPIVLNEFLPNAGNYPEFIEIYNKTGSPINLQGYKIRTDNKVIPINPATTGRFSNGNTTISAYGWLVVAAPVATPYPPPGWKDIIDDNAGTITLYNKKNVEIDSYSYNSGCCVLTPTPAGGNIDNSSGSCSPIPVDKSYARIPDGVGDWVDPVPTIGGPNRLSLGEVNATIADESVVEGVVEKEIVEDNEIPDPLVADNDIFNVLADIGGEIIDAVTGGGSGGGADADTDAGDEADAEAPVDETGDEAPEQSEVQPPTNDDEVLDTLIINNNTFIASSALSIESAVDEIEDGDCADADTGDGEEAVTNAPVEPVEPIEQSENELQTVDDEVDSGNDEVLDMLIINNNTFIATGTTDTESAVDEIGDGNNDNAEEVPADETPVVVEPEPVEPTSRDSE